MEITPEELEEKKQMVLNECICAGCPSWADCGEEGGYCFPTVGKSACITEEQGCICGLCPVTAKIGLKHGYYCTRGSDQEQSG